jgi:hypothetical protein
MASCLANTGLFFQRVARRAEDSNAFWKFLVSDAVFGKLKLGLQRAGSLGLAGARPSIGQPMTSELKW